jgi:tetratricopeptide (TPR) repeat protein
VQDAMRASSAKESLTLLQAAVNADPLNPDLPRILGNARLQFAAEKDAEQIRKAIAAFMLSAMRNPESFKAYERLSVAYERLARSQIGDERTASLQHALTWAGKTLECYPACDRELLLRAQLAEQLGRNDLALRDYRHAVQIEDAYRVQFRTMYPTRPMVSRLGEKNYKESKSRIAELEKGG